MPRAALDIHAKIGYADTLLNIFRHIAADVERLVCSSSGQQA